MRTMFLKSALLFIYILLNPPLYLLLAENTVKAGRAVRQRVKPAAEPSLEWDVSELLLFGLLVYLCLAFFLWHFGLPLWASALLPFLGSVTSPRRAAATLRKVKVTAHVNLLLWLLVIFVLGVSIFTTSNGIATPWANNYGDLTFHLGMIASFVFGENRAPEYHLYAGEALSYPFFVNLWSALIWWINPDFKSLVLVFIFQWTLIWGLIYHFLDGNKKWFLPWLLLFGGGSYLYLGANSGQLIGKNAPWCVFLTTIWIPQRGAFFGAAGLLAAVRIFHRALGFSPPDKALLTRSGLLFSLLPLVHTHLFLIGICYCSGVLFLRMFVPALQRSYGAQCLHDFACFVRPLFLGLIFLPWLIGKTGMIKGMWGWITGEVPPETSRLGAAMSVWFSLSTSFVWILLIGALWFISRRHLQCIVILLLFIASNFIQAAQWEWDQIKLFLGLYAITLALWSSIEGRAAKLCQLAAPLLLFPALYEVWHIAKDAPLFTVYSKEEVDMALAIRERTKPTDVIAAAPRHNSLATLTGRLMFYGYEGTLSSHGIDYFARKIVMENLDLLATCKRSLSEAHKRCPNYLLWGPMEKEDFKKDEPPPPFQKTELPYLFRVPS